MWPLTNTEIKISSDNGESYFQKLRIFLESNFQAEFTDHQNVSFDMDCYDFNIGNQTVTVFCEGMSGTSLKGPKKLVNTIIAEAKASSSDLVDIE